MASATVCAPAPFSKSPFAIKAGSPSDDEFSLYFSLIRENFPPELGATRRSIRISLGRMTNDGEIDIFDAEKYFSGRMDTKLELAKEEGEEEKPKLGAIPSSSGSSGNSQSESAILRDHRKAAAAPAKQGGRKGLLSVFRCSCSGKKAFEESSQSNTKNEGETGRSGAGAGESSFRMGRRANTSMDAASSSLLVRDLFGSSRRVALNAVAAAAAREEEIVSDSSSDLFEIESISTNSHPYFRPESSVACYEPSEVSVEWSVVTASAANIDYGNEDTVSARGNEATVSLRRRRPGNLLGCASDKAVEPAAGYRRRESSQRPPPPPPPVRWSGRGVMDAESTRRRVRALPRARLSV